MDNSTGENTIQDHFDFEIKYEYASSVKVHGITVWGILKGYVKNKGEIETSLTACLDVENVTEGCKTLQWISRRDDGSYVAFEKLETLPKNETAELWLLYVREYSSKKRSPYLIETATHSESAKCYFLELNEMYTPRLKIGYDKDKTETWEFDFRLGGYGSSVIAKPLKISFLDYQKVKRKRRYYPEAGSGGTHVID